MAWNDRRSTERAGLRQRARCACALLLLSAAGCSNEVPTPPDETVPARVSDLRVADVDDSTVTLSWTAPGDDGAAGPVSAYEIRWLNTPFAEPNWESGTTVGPAPAPLAPGSIQTARVLGVPPGRDRYLALRATDDAGNPSLVSNNVLARTGAPVCRLTPDTLDFGAAPPGSAFELALVIENLGGGTLRGEIAGECGSFHVPTGSGTLALRAGGRHAAFIRFSPPGDGPFTCSLSTGSSCGAIFLRGRGESSGATFVPVPAGAGIDFRMGSPRGELGRDSTDERRHEVRLTRSFRVADREVTQAEWFTVMGWNESSAGGADRPVENVTWFDALAYCNLLSEREGRRPAYDLGEITRDENHIVSALVVWDPTRDGYRLPTEAEWEFVCRAGGEGAFFAGDLTQLACRPPDPVLAPIGWYCGNASTGTRPVRSLAPNALGLHDTHGNVFEWCWDFYDPEYGLDFPDPPEEPPLAVNPLGPESGTSRICRGGSWSVNPQSCRSAFRYYHLPGNRYDDVGLRLVRPVD